MILVHTINCSYFSPILRHFLYLPHQFHLSGLNVNHRSPGCFFVYAFNFAQGHWCLIMFPHWDKQVILLRVDNVEDLEKAMHFSCWIFVLLSLLLFPCCCLLLRLSNQGHVFTWKSDKVLSVREDVCLINECDPGCLYVLLQRKQWLDVACPDHRSLHVRFGVPFVALAALLSQSVSGCEPFWQ